jgi:hypothetical protein
MSERPLRQLLVAGLQGTGKTSFLAIFYLAVDNEPARLSLGSYKDDRNYLNKIAGHLLRGEETKHTPLPEPEQLSLSLKVVDSGEPVALRIPDLSGETWAHATKERWWTPTIEDHVDNAEAVLVFVHPDLEAGATIGEARAAAEAVGVEPQPASDSEPTQSEGDFEVGGDSPDQVLVTDLLQLTVEQRGQRPARACIMISAWDTQPDGLTPEAFVAQNMPLLQQYIDSNQNWLTTRVYGVSAQGGDFERDRDQLLEQDAVERAYVRAADGTEVEIEEPVTWALGLDET